MSDCCLTPSEQVFCYIKARTSYILMSWLSMLSALY